MPLLIRDVCEQELPQVLALNNAAGPTILPLDGQRLAELFDAAPYFRVAEIDGHLAGFLIALSAQTAYHSVNLHAAGNSTAQHESCERLFPNPPSAFPEHRGGGKARSEYSTNLNDLHANFRWFAERYPDFVYIDRIVIAASYRRLGLGRIFYADVQSFAEVRSPLLACAIFLEPRDDASVLFHGTYGFREVGQQVVDGRRIGLLVKELCSYPWVRSQYLQAPAGGLPAQPWLSARSHHAAACAQLARHG